MQLMYYYYYYYSFVNGGLRKGKRYLWIMAYSIWLARANANRTNEWKSSYSHDVTGDTPHFFSLFFGFRYSTERAAVWLYSWTIAFYTFTLWLTLNENDRKCNRQNHWRLTRHEKKKKYTLTHTFGGVMIMGGFMKSFWIDTALLSRCTIKINSMGFWEYVYKKHPRLICFNDKTSTRIYCAQQTHVGTFVIIIISEYESNRQQFHR